MTAENELARKNAVHPHEGYLATIESMEPDVSAVDASAFYASAAISLKRMADAAEQSNALMRAYLEHQDYRFREWYARKFPADTPPEKHNPMRDGSGSNLMKDA